MSNLDDDGVENVDKNDEKVKENADADKEEEDYDE